jgi:hypothetical protein
VSDCQLHYESNAPTKRDFLGTMMLSALAGHWRYAHITTLRCEPGEFAAVGNGRSGERGRGAVRRGFEKVEAGVRLAAGASRLHHAAALSEPWILDIDTTVKPLYGHQQGAE